MWVMIFKKAWLLSNNKRIWINVLWKYIHSEDKSRDGDLNVNHVPIALARGRKEERKRKRKRREGRRERRGRKEGKNLSALPPAMARTYKAATFLLYFRGKNNWIVSLKACIKFISFDKAVSLLWRKKHMWVINEIIYVI